MSTGIQGLYSLNEEVRKLILDKLDGKTDGPNKERSTYAAYVTAKALNTHDSIILLCKKGYGEDALMLARTLLELMVSALYIFQDETDSRLTRYREHGWIMLGKVYNYYKNPNHPNPELFEKIASGKFEFETPENVTIKINELKQKYGERFGGNEWSDKSIVDMSSAIGVEYLYHTVYRLQCMNSHSTAGSMGNYIELADAGVIADIGANPKNIDYVLVNAFDCFCRIMIAVDKEFSWGLQNQLVELYKKFASEVVQINQ